MTKFYFHRKSKFRWSMHLNTCKYYVCGIKLETKVMRLHKIRAEKISLFHQRSVLSITFDYYL